MTNIADTLRAAKALIDTPEKWVKGAYLSTEGAARRCAAAAILHASFDLDLVAGARSFFGKIIPDRLPIEAWNDAPERTHAEVMDAFDRAIAAAEAE